MINHKIQIQNREFSLSIEIDKEDYLFLAGQKVFKEIDELKKKNKELINKMNSLSKNKIK